MYTSCKILYVGETMRRLADRFTEHLRSIKCNLDGFPVQTDSLNTCAVSNAILMASHWPATSIPFYMHYQRFTSWGVIHAKGNNKKECVIAEHSLFSSLGLFNLLVQIASSIVLIYNICLLDFPHHFCLSLQDYLVLVFKYSYVFSHTLVLVNKYLRPTHWLQYAHTSVSGVYESIRPKKKK